MLVVADCSPINILVRIAAIEILPRLFATVLIPPEVRDELFDPRTPGDVRAFIASPPPWLLVKAAKTVERIPTLGSGEEAAIALARDLRSDALLIDDPSGRRAAAERGIVVIGTLGILERAAALGMIGLPDVVRRLERTDFRLSPRLLRAALERDAQRRAETQRSEPGSAPPSPG